MGPARGILGKGIRYRKCVVAKVAFFHLEILGCPLSLIKAAWHFAFEEPGAELEEPVDCILSNNERRPAPVSGWKECKQSDSALNLWPASVREQTSVMNYLEPTFLLLRNSFLDPVLRDYSAVESSAASHPVIPSWY